MPDLKVTAAREKQSNHQNCVSTLCDSRMWEDQFRKSPMSTDAEALGLAQYAFTIVSFAGQWCSRKKCDATKDIRSGDLAYNAILAEDMSGLCKLNLGRRSHAKALRLMVGAYKTQHQALCLVVGAYNLQQQEHYTWWNVHYTWWYVHVNHSNKSTMAADSCIQLTK